MASANKVICPRCLGTLSKRRGQSMASVIAVHEQTCPSPPPNNKEKKK